MQEWLSAGWDAIPAVVLWVQVPLTLLGYVVFGLTGFGSAVISTPVFAHFMPLQFVIPYQTLLDTIAGLALSSRTHARALRGELLRMLPGMLVGLVAGVLLLTSLRDRVLMVALGLVVCAYGLAGSADRLGTSRISAWWAVPASLAGGLLSALFGIGGVAYIMYLSRRGGDKSEMRATMNVIVMVSNFIRMVLYGLAGFITQDGLFTLMLLMLPLALVGMRLGNLLHDRLPVEAIRRVVYGLLVVSGLSLVVRGL